MVFDEVINEQSKTLESQLHNEIESGWKNVHDLLYKNDKRTYWFFLKQYKSRFNPPKNKAEK